jgi:hypothetical protein
LSLVQPLRANLYIGKITKGKRRCGQVKSLHRQN